MQKEVLFAHFPGYSNKRLLALKRVFSSLDEAFVATDLSKTGWKQKTIDHFLQWKSSVNVPELQEVLCKHHIQTLTLEDPLYPLSLKGVYDPPQVLFVRGDLSTLNYPFAIVGTRKPTPYGKRATQDIASNLSKHMSIVSGLALGIDGIAHESCLQAHGHTVAVLAGGIDDATIAPRSHLGLAQRILKAGGAILSEYPPGYKPQQFTYPTRNRIIAGMSKGVLVNEAASKSGALITAQYALDHGRDVFALPQSIYNVSGQGANKLLAHGAHLVAGAHTIIEYYEIDQNHVAPSHALPLSDDERSICELLTQQSLHIDEILQKLPYLSTKIMSCLTVLEMKGKVKNLGNMTYCLHR